MTTPLPPPPRIRSIVLGILVTAVLVAVLFSASSVVKWLGAPFLIVPRALGMIGSYGPREIVEIPMGSPPTVVTFPHAEAYAVYVSDLRLLQVADVIEASGAPPWLVVQRADSGASIPLETVGRGLLPFDEPRVSGRPVYTFTIDQPGTYVMSHPRSVSSIYFVPNRVIGKETLLGWAAAIQLALLALPMLWVFMPRWLERRRSWRVHQRERRAATEQVRRRQQARRAVEGPANRSEPRT
jgi:hypothetical protein